MCPAGSMGEMRTREGEDGALWKTNIHKGAIVMTTTRISSTQKSIRRKYFGVVKKIHRDEIGIDIGIRCHGTADGLWWVTKDKMIGAEPHKDIIEEGIRLAIERDDVKGSFTKGGIRRQVEEYQLILEKTERQGNEESEEEDESEDSGWLIGTSGDSSSGDTTTNMTSTTRTPSGSGGDRDDQTTL